MSSGWGASDTRYAGVPTPQLLAGLQSESPAGRSRETQLYETCDTLRNERDEMIAILQALREEYTRLGHAEQSYPASLRENHLKGNLAEFEQLVYDHDQLIEATERTADTFAETRRHLRAIEIRPQAQPDSGGPTAAWLIGTTAAQAACRAAHGEQLARRLASDLDSQVGVILRKLSVGHLAAGESTLPFLLQPGDFPEKARPLRAGPAYPRPFPNPPLSDGPRGSMVRWLAGPLDVAEYDLLWHLSSRTPEQRPPLISCASPGETFRQRALLEQRSVVGLHALGYRRDSAQFAAFQRATHILACSTTEFGLVWRSEPQIRVVLAELGGQHVLLYAVVRGMSGNEITDGHFWIGFHCPCHVPASLVALMPSRPRGTFLSRRSRRATESFSLSLPAMEQLDEFLKTRPSSLMDNPVSTVRNKIASLDGGVLGGTADKGHSAAALTTLITEKSLGHGELSVSVRHTPASERRHSEKMVVNDLESGRFLVAQRNRCYPEAPGKEIVIRGVGPDDLLGELAQARYALHNTPRRW